MELGLGGRIAFVAGSSRGIGHAIAQRLHDEGARVTVSGRSPDRVATAAREIGGATPDRIHAVVGDLSQRDGIAEALRDTVSHFGGLDIVIGCIGDGTGTTGWQQDDEVWRKIFGNNLWPAVRLAELAIPYLANRTGASILLIGSIAGRAPLGPIPYGVAKSALASYAARLSGEVGNLGIRVVCIEPGNVLVPGGRWAEKLAEDPEAVHTMLERDVALKRLANPNEIADVAVFFASDRASFATGARIVVDGGQCPAT